MINKKANNYIKELHDKYYKKTDIINPIDIKNNEKIKSNEIPNIITKNNNSNTHIRIPTKLNYTIGKII